MTNATELLSSIRRPRLLIRAAKFGLEEYRRERDLKRVMGTASAPSPARAVQDLISREAQLEETRRAGDAAYSVTRHVDVLIALMAEARLLPQSECRAGPGGT